MKLISAIVKPHKLNSVKDALQAIGVRGMTVSQVQGFGRQRGHTEVYRGAEYTIDFVPKIKVEILIADDSETLVVNTILESASSGSIGDGKIWVTPVEDAVRIRTGERGNDAIDQEQGR